jgi:cell division protein FtsB
MSEKRQRRPRRLLVLICCLAAAGYFAGHAVHGRHGFEARHRLLARAELIGPEIVRLEATRASLERDVRLLSDPSPDTDFIAELAADMLGFAAADEHVLLATRGR